ncbi:MAG: hypothetical protein U5K38_17190 [Woeseiaceae bacterium]|nr:hypothetical protein [Woeseiaceae bacterium]
MKSFRNTTSLGFNVDAVDRIRPGTPVPDNNVSIHFLANESYRIQKYDARRLA